MTTAANSPAAQAPEEDVTTSLYRAAIGPVSTPYYLPIFTRFEAADHAGISWNTAASLSTFNWLVFRKLWAAALAYVGIVVAIVVLVFGIGRLVFQFSDTLMMALGLGFALAAFVLPGLFGNAVLHVESRRRMAAAVAAHTDVQNACTQLTRQASTRRRAIAIAAANVVFWLLMLLVYLQFSALGSLAVMPQGALESGNVVVGRTVDASASASTPEAAPVTAASAAASAPSVPLGPASAASEPAAAASATAPAPAASTAQGPAPAPETSASAVKRAPVASKPQPSVKKAVEKNVPAKPAKATKVTKDAKADKLEKPYFINVGLFAKPENAAGAHTKLLAAQLPSVTKELKTSKGLLTRVRVGPFKSQSQAQTAVEKIKALQLDAIIVQP